MTRSLGDLDHRLLRLLRANARETHVNLARALDTSEGTVRSRLKRLVDDGVIQRFTVRTAKANIKALIEIESDTNVHTSRLTSQIAEWDDVEAVYEVSGDEDIVVIAQADDTEELNELIESIRKLPNVKSTRSRLIFKES